MKQEIANTIEFMDLSIIIVSFNTKELLEKCLTSFFRFLKGISFEVIVVDNASTDGSVQVAKSFKGVKVIENKKNLGFGTANNQGAKTAIGKWLFFFNSDAYLIDNSLPKLLERLNKDKKIGVAGPLILNTDRTIQQSVGFFPNLPQVFYWMSFLDDLPGGDLLKPYHVDHDGFYKKEQKVDWVTGAAMIARKDVFKKVNGFDEKIFLYSEDVDLCYKIKAAGFKIIFSPAAIVVHLGRGSHKGTNIGAIVGEYKGVLYFYKKYKGQAAQVILKILLKAGAILRIFVFGLVLRRSELLKAYWMAFNTN